MLALLTLMAALGIGCIILIVIDGIGNAINDRRTNPFRTKGRRMSAW